MAFSDNNIRWWHTDLTTRAGAEAAASQGSIASFVFTGMAVLGMILIGGMAGYSTADGISAVVGGGIEALVGLVAGSAFGQAKAHIGELLRSCLSVWRLSSSF